MTPDNKRQKEAIDEEVVRRMQPFAEAVNAALAKIDSLSDDSRPSREVMLAVADAMRGAADVAASVAIKATAVNASLMVDEELGEGTGHVDVEAAQHAGDNAWRLAFAIFMDLVSAPHQQAQ